MTTGNYLKNIPMNQYKVTWEIDIWAETPEEAANTAFALQGQNDTTATIYSVTDEKTNEITIIDLNELYD